MSNDAKTFDITALNAEKIYQEVYAEVISKMSNITDEKIKVIVDKTLEKCIERALKIVGENADQIKRQVGPIKESAACQKLFKSIFDMVLNISLVKGSDVVPRNSGEGDLLIMSTRMAAELEASILQDANEYQRSGTPEIEDVANAVTNQKK